MGRAHRERARRLAALARVRLLLLLALGSAVPAGAQQAREPFALSEWRVPGRPVELFVVRDEAGRERVLVISLEGSAPEERRFVSWLPEDRSHPASPLEIPRATVAVDAAELGLAPGPELVTLSAHELR